MYFYIIQYHITELLLNILKILYTYEEEVDFSFTITKNLRVKKIWIRSVQWKEYLNMINLLSILHDSQNEPISWPQTYSTTLRLNTLLSSLLWHIYDIDNIIY